MPGRLFRRRRSAAPPDPAGSGPPFVPGFSDLTRIGVGGFSVVYRARQDALGREVALKVLDVDLSDPRASERFRRECEAVGPLSDHPNIVTVHGAGVAPDGRPWLAMELCEQGSLADRIRIRGVLAPDEVLRVGIKVAGALDAAHRAGVLHRDVKPENFLVTKSGEPALADFGIAVIADHRDAAITEAFSISHAAPEVLEGGRPTPAADVYGLGSALWTLLVGHPPFEEQPGEGLLPFLRRVTTEPVPPTGRGDVPAGMEEILHAALSKDPAGRPQSAIGFASMLRDVQLSLGLSETPAAPWRWNPGAAAPIGDASATVVKPRPDDPAGTPAPAPTGRRRVWVAVASVAAVVILAAAVAMARNGMRQDPAPRPSTTAPVLTTAPAPTTTAPATTGAALPPPTGLQAKVSSPSTVDLRWTAPTAGRRPYVVTTQPSGATVTVTADRTTATISGLSTATTRYCFVVGAVYVLRDGTSRFALSDTACT